MDDTDDTLFLERVSSTQVLVLNVFEFLFKPGVSIVILI